RGPSPRGGQCIMFLSASRLLRCCHLSRDFHSYTKDLPFIAFHLINGAELSTMQLSSRGLSPWSGYNRYRKPGLLSTTQPQQLELKYKYHQYKRVECAYGYV